MAEMDFSTDSQQVLRVLLQFYNDECVSKCVADEHRQALYAVIEKLADTSGFYLVRVPHCAILGAKFLDGPIFTGLFKAENNDTLSFNGGTVKDMILLHLDTAVELLMGEASDLELQQVIDERILLRFLAVKMDVQLLVEVQNNIKHVL